MAMNRVVKQKWLNALRSGKYEQVKGALKSNGGYCCLGVLCEITGNSKNRDMQEGFPITNENGDADDFMGLTGRMQNNLAHMNDNQLMSFEQIATYISRNVKVK